MVDTVALPEDPQPKRFRTHLTTTLLVFICLNVSAWLWGNQYGEILLPVYQWSFETLTPYFKIQSLRIEQENGERVVKIYVRTAASRRLGGQSIQNGVPILSSTLLGNALQHAIVLFTAIFLWPVRTWQGRSILILLAIPVLVLIELIDIPLVLAGSLEDLILVNYDPSRLSSSLLVQGMLLMNSGGRLALSIFFAVLTIVVWKIVIKCCFLSRY